MFLFGKIYLHLNRENIVTAGYSKPHLWWTVNFKSCFRNSGTNQYKISVLEIFLIYFFFPEFLPFFIFCIRSFRDRICSSVVVKFRVITFSNSSIFRSFSACSFFADFSAAEIFWCSSKFWNSKFVTISVKFSSILKIRNFLTF